MQDIFTFIANHLALTYALVGVFVLLTIIEFIRKKRNNFQIEATRAVYLINRENAVVIDLRPLDAFKKGHIIDAQAIAQRDLQQSLKKIEKFKARPLIFVCGQGLESQKIAANLLNQGYNSYSLSGGMRSWISAELPLVKE